MAGRCARISDSTGFAVAAFALIVANAAVLGVETYSGTARDWHAELRIAETFFLVAFTAELAIRIAAFGNRPGRFLRDGWNAFDFLVVAAAFVPVVRENATVLRLLRLARVLRAVRMFPQVRVILNAAWKSLPGALGFLVVGALVLYMYAMLGWILFADTMPEHYGSLGRACLTLFFLMALDGLGEMVREGLEVSRWTALYFGSYVLVSSFLLVNLLIGVVITSLEDARASDDQAAAAAPAATGAPGNGVGSIAHDEREIRHRIAELRCALDALENTLARSPGGRDRAGPDPPAGREG
ncbi:ion transporter [Yinghuangia sp. YIM S09857]|uniref:ion transporter n=1 Tax=Yinghuangia sp. YIM S09857 TaxID=3436929 RepID=UPI003F535903